MFLIEAERGCSRRCGYCVMRGANSGGMRVVSEERILESIPGDAPRVGLVGAGVSDHPSIISIVENLAERGVEVGLSSLRPDRLSEPFVKALVRGGCRTLTTALDGASERLRQMVERRCSTDHFRQIAELCRQNKISRLKLYLMVGLPSETDEDIDECASLLTELSSLTSVSVGISPFCAKENTPLARSPYAGVSTIQSRLTRLRRAVMGRVEIRSTSARWGWVEHVLARGGPNEGLAVLEAVKHGGRFADYRRAFEALGHRIEGTSPVP